MGLGKMETLKRYRYVFIFFLGGLLAIGAGTYYWNSHKQKFLGSVYARQSFLLLDDSKALYGTRNLQAQDVLLLIFSPDYASAETIDSLRVFAKNLRGLAERHVQVAIVTRSRMDTLQNLKKSANYPGRLLSDPSGSIGKILGAWESNIPVRTWGYALVNKQMQVLWAYKSDHFLQLPELDKLSR